MVCCHVMYICTGLMGQTWPAVIATGPKNKIQFNSIHQEVQIPYSLVLLGTDLYVVFTTC